LIRFYNCFEYFFAEKTLRGSGIRFIDIPLLTVYHSFTMKTKVISFDADGTVVNSNYVNKFWFQELPKAYAEKKEIEFEEAREELVELYDEIGDEDIRWYRPEYWFDRFDLEPEPQEVIERIREPENVEFYPDALEVIDKFKDDYVLIVTSNSPRTFLDYALKELGESFDAVYSCVSDFGEVKKDESVYRRVTELLDVRGEEIVHVGDHWRFDYKAPRKIGIETFYINRDGKDGKEDEDGVIEDMREMIERVDGK